MGLNLIKWALEHGPPGLSPLQRVGLLALCEWARDETGECWPGRLALAHRLERSERTADRVLESLVTAGVVVRVSPAAPERRPVFRIVRQQVAHERGTTGGARTRANVRQIGGVVGHEVSHERETADGAPSRQGSRQEPSAPPAGDPRPAQPTIRAHWRGRARIVAELANLVGAAGWAEARIEGAMATWEQHPGDVRDVDSVAGALLAKVKRGDRDVGALVAMLARAENAAPPAELIPPCGKCEARPGDSSPTARRIYDRPDDPTDPGRRCPNCHPVEVNRHAS